jgi:hypothetical protein
MREPEDGGAVRAPQPADDEPARGRPSLAALTLLALAILAGLAITIDALGDRGGDPAFELRQQQGAGLADLEASTLERAVASAPEPRPGGGGAPARRVRCTATTAANDEWRCRASYDGVRRVYRVEIAPDGAWRGTTRDGAYVVSGELDLGG